MFLQVAFLLLHSPVEFAFWKVYSGSLTSDIQLVIVFYTNWIPDGNINMVILHMYGEVEPYLMTSLVSRPPAKCDHFPCSYSILI